MKSILLLCLSIFLVLSLSIGFTVSVAGETMVDYPATSQTPTPTEEPLTDEEIDQLEQDLLNELDLIEEEINNYIGDVEQELQQPILEEETLEQELDTYLNETEKYMDEIIQQGLTVITLIIGDPLMQVNDIDFEVDPGRGTVPVIRNSRTLLPIRTIVESLGGEILWSDAEKKVTINYNGRTIDMWIGELDMLVDGIVVKNDVEPQIINARTFLPLRFVAENMGCKVGWTDETKTVTILK